MNPDQLYLRQDEAFPSALRDLTTLLLLGQHSDRLQACLVISARMMGIGKIGCGEHELPASLAQFIGQGHSLGDHAQTEINMTPLIAAGLGEANHVYCVLDLCSDDIADQVATLQRRALADGQIRYAVYDRQRVYATSSIGDVARLVKERQSNPVRNSTLNIAQAACLCSLILDEMMRGASRSPKLRVQGELPAIVKQATFSLEMLEEEILVLIGTGGIGTAVLFCLDLCSVFEERSTKPQRRRRPAKVDQYDYDIVDWSNLPRQYYFSPESIGRLKVDVIADFFAGNSWLEVTPNARKITSSDDPALKRKNSIIVAGPDNNETRGVVAFAGHVNKIPTLIAGSSVHGAQIHAMPANSATCYRCCGGQVEDVLEAQSCSLEAQATLPPNLLAAGCILAQISHLVRDPHSVTPTLLRCDVGQDSGGRNSLWEESLPLACREDDSECFNSSLAASIERTVS